MTVIIRKNLNAISVISSNFLFGEAGADTFIMGGFFGSGNNYINQVDGGSGADVLDYSLVTTGAISVTLDGEVAVKVSKLNKLLNKIFRT